MPVIDSYDNSNQDGETSLADANNAVGQGFTGNGESVDQATFMARKAFDPVGSAKAQVFAHSGTFGSSGIPTGSALATSNSITATDFSTSLVNVTFDFATPFTTVNGTKYFIVFDYPDGVGINQLKVGSDVSSPTHAGNLALLQTSTWSALGGTLDNVFSVDFFALNSVSDRFSMLGL